MAMGMAGWFIAQPDQKLGTLYMRDTTLKFVVNPRLTTFSGPLAILVDGASASTSEIMAEGLKDLGRARIFGSAHRRRGPAVGVRKAAGRRRISVCHRQLHFRRRPAAGRAWA